MSLALTQAAPSKKQSKSILNTLAVVLIQTISSYLVPVENHSLLLTARAFNVVYTTPLLFTFERTRLKVLQRMANSQFKIITGGTFFTEDEFSIQLPVKISNTIRIMDLTSSRMSENNIVDFYDFAQYPNLEEFSCDGKILFSKINPTGLQLCQRLRELELFNCLQLKDVSFLHNMASLTQLSIHNCPLQDISKLAGCVNLEYLKLDKVAIILDLSVLATLPHLHTFKYTHSDYIAMEQLAGCVNLTKLTFSHNPESEEQNIPVGAFSNLQFLKIENCTTITWLPPLPSVHTLHIKSVDAMLSIESIQGIDNVPNITKLTLKKCPLLRDVKGLKMCTKLFHLELFHFPSIGVNPILDLSELKYCPSIKELHMEHIRLCYTLHYCQHLEKLHIKDCHKDNLVNFTSATSLSHLSLIDSFISLGEIKGCTSLEELQYEIHDDYFPHMHVDISGLTKLTKIKTRISGVVTKINDYEWMCNPPNVDTLHLEISHRFEDAKSGSINRACNINNLIISNITCDNYNFLSLFTSITTLHLEHWSFIDGLNFISDMRSLEHLRISKCAIVSLYPLHTCIFLDTLTLFRCQQHNTKKSFFDPTARETTLVPILDFTLKDCNTNNTLLSSIQTKLFDPVQSQLLQLCCFLTK